jgi:hypothetical protein
MHLHYGGRLWAPALERVLGEEIGAAQSRLEALVRRGVPG